MRAEIFSGILVFTVMLSVSCQREERNPRSVPARSANVPGLPPLSEISPGGPASQPTGKSPSGLSNPYHGNAYAISEGQNLYQWFNCEGCHSAYGGGGMGPALNDNKWIYGGEPRQIFETIARGRPNGMPAWGSRITEDRIWQLVAYVESLAGNQPKITIPPRSDSIERNPGNIRNKVRGETR